MLIFVVKNFKLFYFMKLEGDPVSQATKRRRIIWDLLPGVYYDFFVRTRSNGRLSEPSNAGTRIRKFIRKILNYIIKNVPFVNHC